MEGASDEAFAERDQSGQPSTSGMPFDTQEGASLDLGCSDFQLLKRVLVVCWAAIGACCAILCVLVM